MLFHNARLFEHFLLGIVEVSLDPIGFCVSYDMNIFSSVFIDGDRSVNGLSIAFIL